METQPGPCGKISQVPPPLALAPFPSLCAAPCALPRGSLKSQTGLARAIGSCTGTLLSLFLRFKYVIGIGVGAGAYVLAKFAVSEPWLGAFCRVTQDPIEQGRCDPLPREVMGQRES